MIHVVQIVGVGERVCKRVSVCLWKGRMCVCLSACSLLVVDVVVVVVFVVIVDVVMKAVT